MNKLFPIVLALMFFSCDEDVKTSINKQDRSNYLQEEEDFAEEEKNTIIETIDVPPPKDVLQQKPNSPTIPEPTDYEFFEEEDMVWDDEFQDANFDDWNDWDAPTPDESISSFIPFDTPPQPKREMEIKPIYPKMAKEAGIEGTVYIRFFIDEKGNVTEAYVKKGVPNTGLDEAALKAVIKSKWKPAIQRQKKVGAWQTVPVRFKLN